VAPEPKTAEAKPAQLQLPVMVVGPIDLGRLIRELETMDEALVQEGLRNGEKDVHPPKVSKMLDKTMGLNKLDLLQDADRQTLHKMLTDVRQHAPVMHFSFSADPAPAFAEKLIAWLRKEIHPLVLMTVGLQPNIGAGCILRTANHQFDFSLRQDIETKRDILMQQIQLQATQPQKTAAPAQQPQEQPA